MDVYPSNIDRVKTYSTPGDREFQRASFLFLTHFSHLLKIRFVHKQNHRKSKKDQRRTISKEKNFITKSNKKQKKTKGEGSQNKVPKKDKKRNATTFLILNFKKSPVSLFFSFLGTLFWESLPLSLIHI